MQVIADSIGRSVSISPPLPGTRHAVGAAREHGIIGTLSDRQIRAAAGPRLSMRGSTVAVPQRRRRLDPDTGRHRRLSSNQRHVKIRPQASPGAGGASQRRAEELVHPAQDPLQPERREQAHRCSSETYAHRVLIRLPEAQWPCRNAHIRDYAAR